MTLNQLCTWLRENSSGVYRNTAVAADEIERLAQALNDVMAGMADHDIPGETGFQEAHCQCIAGVRSDARDLVREMAFRSTTTAGT